MGKGQEVQAKEWCTCTKVVFIYEDYLTEHVQMCIMSLCLPQN